MLNKVISTDNNNYYRDIHINTIKHGLLIFKLIRIPSKINHRNHVDIRFNEPNRVSRYNCCGTLICLRHIETVPSLLHINDSTNIVLSKTKLLTIDEYEDIKKEYLIEKDKNYRKAGKQNMHKLGQKDPLKAYQIMIKKYIDENYQFSENELC